MSKPLPTREAHDAGPAQAIRARLEAILQSTLTEARGSGIDQKAPAWCTLPLTSLGVNSVDYLRFMNAVEEQFGIVVSGPSARGLPSSLDDWTEFVRQHTAAKEKNRLAKYFGGLLKICKGTPWRQGFQR